MSTKFFLPNLGSSYSHVEDVVARRLGRSARVSECVHHVSLTDSLLSHEETDLKRGEKATLSKPPRLRRRSEIPHNCAQY